MEDMGGGGSGEKREMVTPQLRARSPSRDTRFWVLTRVKLCRWTKAQLRGRGGCYKHSFYGIESHRCMETTPSLACANKCVFCWRHHTNPVGREWRWQMDDAETIVEKAVSEHRGMIKQMKGVPGVLPERLAEGMDPRHCALSLVGEPIMYPEIDKFVSLLHAKRISTFLVTNAQFPDAITNLPAITQLYVSVDAATPETLKAIDRPLFGDYWVRSSRGRGGDRRAFLRYRAELSRGPPFLPRKKRAPLCQTATAPSWALDCREVPTPTSPEDPALRCPSETRDKRRPHANGASSDPGTTPRRARLTPPLFFPQTKNPCPPIGPSSRRQERFVGSLSSLREKRQRTVYRLTLVAGWNASDAAEYAKLIDLGKPDLIEIKGMTYCGATSGASNLTMKNVPYHEDVKKFGEALCTARLDLVSGRDAASTSTLTPTELATMEEPEPKTGGTPRSAEYGLACEHAHSCCILLARKDPYLVDGKWHTWIDYEKFQELVASGEPFTSDQYMLPTPRWSVWGAEEGGFDPGETRVRKVRNHPGKEKKEEGAA